MTFNEWDFNPYIYFNFCIWNKNAKLMLTFSLMFVKLFRKKCPGPTNASSEGDCSPNREGSHVKNGAFSVRAAASKRKCSGSVVV